MKRLFGTDGIRAVAGMAPLDPETVRRFGRAVARVLRSAAGHPARVVVGRDTRESGPWLAEAVAIGIASEGGSTHDAGIITTPGLAFSTRSGRFDAGVMISASHNPFTDNGLKVFGPDAQKLSDDLEHEIESLLLESDLPDPGAGPGKAQEDGSLLGRYVAYLEGSVPGRRPFAGTRILLDCANGAAYEIAPRVFRHFGALVETMGDAPNGRNINLDCGSLHTEALGRAVGAGGFQLGLAFDGDADRCLAVDRKGRLIDGDHILYLTGTRLKRAGALPGDALVATVMSNFWLEQRLAREGIHLHRAPVGDKYVLEKMIEEDAVLGGEQSGHIIFRDRSTTGDGILTGLLLLETILELRQPIELFMDGVVPCPQILLNVRVKYKPDLRRHATIGPVVAEIEKSLDGAGRVVLRYSGTEPLARVMVEGIDAAAVQAHAERLAGVIRTVIGE